MNNAAKSASPGPSLNTRMPEEPQEDATARTMREKPRNRKTRRDSESLGYIDREHGNQQPQPIPEDEKKKRHFASFGDTDTHKKKTTHTHTIPTWMNGTEGAIEC